MRQGFVSMLCVLYKKHNPQATTIILFPVDCSDELIIAEWLEKKKKKKVSENFPFLFHTERKLIYKERFSGTRLTGNKLFLKGNLTFRKSAPVAGCREVLLTWTY